MNKNLNDKIKELIANNKITINLCFICLANLNDKINYANRDYSYLEPQRNVIAKVLLDNGLDKETIAEKITTIHKDCYPTLKGQIKAIYDMIDSGVCSFVDEQIPENYIKYKSEQEYEEYINKPVVRKNIKDSSLSNNVKEAISDGRILNDLSFEELEDVQYDFRDGVDYNIIRKTYNLKPYLYLDKNLLKVAQDLKDEMLLEDFDWDRNDVEKLIGYYNGYAYGYVFWDEEREIESVEDLIDFLNYNELCFDDELEKVRARKGTRI